MEKLFLNIFIKKSSKNDLYYDLLLDFIFQAKMARKHGPSSVFGLEKLTYKDNLFFDNEFKKKTLFAAK